ncbi:hypothetical protein L7F22_030167 [Adiantum nelumboides]|nr:hypothetical protein [Adiantum nelumboides]
MASGHGKPILIGIFIEAKEKKRSDLLRSTKKETKATSLFTSSAEMGKESFSFDATFFGGLFTESSKVWKSTSFLKGTALTRWSNLYVHGDAPMIWLEFKFEISCAMASQFWKPGVEKPSLLTDEDDGLFFMAAQPHYSSGYMTLERQRQTLPAYKHRTSLLYLMENHATTIVIGETGSGKTTQIPQYLIEGGWSEGGRLIACTQPRRLAVQTVAARVAEEMHVTLGQEVGYSIRFEDMTTPGVTKVKYLTDGVLLREMMEDPLLVKYSVIMVDEAHERSISTDILLGLLKKVQRRRPELRLIIASATLEARSIAAFFDTR